MIRTTAVCAMTVALLAGTAISTVPAAARSTTQKTSHAIPSSRGSGRLFLSAAAIYDAGVRHGIDRSARNAYRRGFTAGASSEAYSDRAYGIAPYAAIPVAATFAYSYEAPYGPWSRGYALYDDGYGGYGGYSVNASGYGAGGYVGAGYVGAGYIPTGLMDVVVAPVAAAPDLRAGRWAYCAARYRSFDPYSGTYLAADGNRYFCH